MTEGTGEAWSSLKGDSQKKGFLKIEAEEDRWDQEYFKSRAAVVAAAGLVVVAAAAAASAEVVVATVEVVVVELVAVVMVATVETVAVVAVVVMPTRGVLEVATAVKVLEEEEEEEEAVAVLCRATSTSVMSTGTVAPTSAESLGSLTSTNRCSRVTAGARLSRSTRFGNTWSSLSVRA